MRMYYMSLEILSIELQYCVTFPCHLSLSHTQHGLINVSATTMSLVLREITRDEY